MNFRRLILTAPAAALLVGLTGLGTGPVAAANFEGETIEWIVPFSTGGGTDTWARFNAPYLSKYLPGQPTVVIKNVPGGGSTTGANQFMARAKPDGLTVLGTSGSTQFPYLLGDPRVKYEYKVWRIVMAYPTGGVVYTKPEFGITSAAEIDKLKGERLVYGAQRPTSLDLVPLLAFKILGLDVQAVMGMKGRGDGRLAFERGEATIDYQTSSAYLANVVPMVEAGNAQPLFSWGSLDEDGNLVRDPTFPDLPHFAEAYEMAKGEKPSGPAWEAWKAFFVAGFPAQKMLFLPEGTSDEIVQDYQNAVRQMKQDPEYQANKDDVLGTYEQVTGKSADALFEVATGVSPESKQWVLDWLSEEYNVTF